MLLVVVGLERVRAVPRLCELYPGICLTTGEKHGKTLAFRVVVRVPVLCDSVLCGINLRVSVTNVLTVVSFNLRL